jgi:predicted nuclease of restriction endonuclease-like (RecB) superfamily
MKLKDLLATIETVHFKTQQAVTTAINKGLSIRNWLVGFYLVEFEQNGAERAAYGDNLLPTVAKNMKIKGFSASDLSRYRQFYLTYPNILATLSQESLKQLDANTILATVSQDSTNSKTHLLSQLSFSHFRELIKIEKDLKRSFYETEAIKGTWSVRELQRQINSLYYERSALSKDKKKLSTSENRTIAKEHKNLLKDFYVFEFLDLPNKETVTESDLETSLLDNIQKLILELGNGFCFEARQKRILIGDEYFFIDLVFYHRILKCHILIELKVDVFNHHNAGQLNTYVEYYNDRVKQEDDNPTIGLLLVTNKNETLVKYATASLENKLFIKKYLVELPKEEDIERELRKFINEQ